MDPQDAIDRGGDAVTVQTATTLLRVVLQHHTQLSAMADLKANIVITASSLVATFAASRLEDPDLRWPMGVLLIGAVAAVILAVLAVLPSAGRLIDHGEKPNLLFFAVFNSLTEDDFVERGQVLLSDRRAMYEAQLRDLHRHGRYLANKKYRFLRLAYLSLLAAIVSAATIQLLVVLTG